MSRISNRGPGDVLGDVEAGLQRGEADSGLDEADQEDQDAATAAREAQAQAQADDVVQFSSTNLPGAQEQRPAFMWVDDPTGLYAPAEQLPTDSQPSSPGPPLSPVGLLARARRSDRYIPAGHGRGDSPAPSEIAQTSTTKRVNSGFVEERANASPPAQVLTALLNLLPFNRSDASEKKDKGDVELDTDDPGPWVVDHHLRNLIEEVVPPEEIPTRDLRRRILNRVRRIKGKSYQNKRLDKNKAPVRTFRVSFAELQRMHLRKLQIRLVKHAVNMYGTKSESDGWEKDLAAYVQAMKDFDYMIECTKRPRDNFLATGEREIDNSVTHSVIRKVFNGHEGLGDVKKTTPVGPWEYDVRPIGGYRNTLTTTASLKELGDRLVLATAGAILLLGPMWLMVLHRTLYTGLITTTVCVAAFGLVVVVSLEKPMDVVSATAAYAAVLVVFVGLTTDSS
ncbi:unnamed protein product [Discula destructiva]